MYLVTVIKDRFDETNTGVEIAGIFSTREKAYTARKIVEEWLKKESFEDGIVMVTEYTLDHLGWYEIDKNLNLEKIN